MEGQFGLNTCLVPMMDIEQRAVTAKLCSCEQALQLQRSSLWLQSLWWGQG